MEEIECEYGGTVWPIQDQNQAGILGTQWACPQREDHTGHVTVIDLTFKNAMADTLNLLSNHQVDMTTSTLSDHHALIFRIGDLDKVVYNAATYSLNWKHAVEETFLEHLKFQLEKERDTYKTLVSEVLNSESVGYARGTRQGSQHHPEHTIPGSVQCSTREINLRQVKALVVTRANHCL